MLNCTQVKTSFFAIGSAWVIYLFASCQTSGDKEKSDAGRPNIVFIVADDMGYGDVGCYNGDSKIPTPHMDSVASEGMILSDAHSSSSISSPTRYGILTGRYSWRSPLKRGALGPFDPLLVDTARYTIADLLKSRGYKTAHVGKWHLGLTYEDSIDYFQPLSPGPLELGYDYFFGKNASLNMSPLCFIENHRVTSKPDLPVPEGIFTNHGNMMMAEGWRHEHVPAALINKAVGFIERHLRNNAGQPFYLHLATHAPHRPCVPPDFLEGRSNAGARGDMVASVDWSVGQIIRVLREHDIFDETLLVITSDNGALNGNTPKYPEDEPLPDTVRFDHQSNHYWRGYKTHIWEGGHRIPFIVRWPGHIQAGSVCDETVCLTDWMATLAALLDVDLPSDAAEDSYNILPALTGQKHRKPIREALVSHSMNGSFAIRKGKWKLILCKGSGGWGAPKNPQYPPGQLYNLKKDSAETNNLYSERPEVVERLKNLLEQYKDAGKSTF